MLYDVPVTEEHIKSTAYMRVKDCMFGRSLQDRFPGNDIKVGVWSAFINNVFISLPKSVSNAIGQWQQKSLVHPFIAQVDIPDEAFTKGAKS